MPNAIGDLVLKTKKEDVDYRELEFETRGIYWFWLDSEDVKALIDLALQTRDELWFRRLAKLGIGESAEIFASWGEEFYL